MKSFEHCLLGLLLIIAVQQVAGRGIDSTWSLGVDIGSKTAFISNTPTFFVQPSISFEKDRHQFTVGPMIRLYTQHAQTDASTPRLSGLFTTYAWTTKTEYPWLRLQFMYEGSIQRIHNRWVSSVFNDGTQFFEAVNFSSTEWITEHTVGYGVRIMLSKRFYIRHNLQAGFYSSGLQVDANGQADESSNNDFRGYSNWGFIWGGRMGLGFRFPVMK